MNRRAWILAFLAGWCVAQAAGCSDSTDKSSNDGGSSGAGKGGSGSGSSGKGGAGTDSTSVGGGTGGASGTSATGGTGTAPDPTNPAACPQTLPADNGACDMDSLECGYGTTECQCEADDSAAMMLVWECSTRGGNQMMCPATEPANGSACTPGRGNCMFGTRVCDCPNETDTWACWDPADCPATPPAERAACDAVGMQCDYQVQGGNQGGGGDDNECECTDVGWDCGGQFCPPAEPTAATECDGGDGVCSYGGGRICDCDSQIWACWAESDCPTAPPAQDSACSLDGMICPFGAGECECDETAWDCDDEVGADADGGV